MSGSGVTLRVEDGGVLAALQHLQEATGDVKPALQGIREYLLRSTEARFDAQVSPEGTAWEPLSAAWAARKAKMGKNQILTLDGYLRDLMRGVVVGNVLLFGSDRKYAAAQQFGHTYHRPARSQTLLRGAKGSKFISEKSAKRRTSFTFEDAEVGAHDQVMPARPFLGLSDGDVVQVLDIIGEYLVGGAT